MQNHNNDNHHIDKLFRQSLESKEVIPNDTVWDEIEESLSIQQMDRIFREGLSEERVIPSDKVWNNVEKQLPLNLRLKRNLHYLSRVAAVVVLGMVGIIYITQPQEDRTEVAAITPIQTDYLNIKLMSSNKVEIPNLTTEQIVTVPKTVICKKSPLQIFTSEIEEIEWYAYDLPTDNTIDNIEKFVLDVDEEKMEALLAPPMALPIEAAVAKFVPKKEEVSASEESGTILPSKLEQLIPATEE